MIKCKFLIINWKRALGKRMKEEVHSDNGVPKYISANKPEEAPINKWKAVKL